MNLLSFWFVRIWGAMWRASVGMLALLFVACAPLSEFQRSPAPIPKDWPLDVRGADAKVAANVHWRVFFNDPRLRALIELALANNRDLRIAAARVEEARAQYGIASADRFPTVNLQGTGSISGTPADLSGTGSPVTSEVYGANLTSVSYELDFWGRLAGLTESARASYLSSKEAQRVVQLSLVADVASAYFALLEMDEHSALARSSVELREQSLALVFKGQELGASYGLELEQARGLLELARAELDSVAHQRTVAANRINFLLGYKTDALPPGNALDEQGADSNIAPGLPGEVLLMRPDVMAAEQRMRAADANIGAARAAFLPKVLLTASMGVASQSLLSLFSGGAWAFQPAISMPLFDGGRLAGGVDLAEARKVIAVAQYERAIQQAFQEVADLLSARESLARQLRAATARMQSQEVRLQITQARHEGGLISFLEVLDGQREFIAAQHAMLQARRTQLDSAAQLYKALGGGLATD